MVENAVQQPKHFSKGTQRLHNNRYCQYLKPCNLETSSSECFLPCDMPLSSFVYFKSHVWLLSYIVTQFCSSFINTARFNLYLCRSADMERPVLFLVDLYYWQNQIIHLPQQTNKHPELSHPIQGLFLNPIHCLSVPIDILINSKTTLWYGGYLLPLPAHWYL